MTKTAKRVAWALSTVEPIEKNVSEHAVWWSACHAVVSQLELPGSHNQQFLQMCRYDYYKTHAQPK
jgi:hypothetical protein